MSARFRLLPPAGPVAVALIVTASLVGTPAPAVSVPPVASPSPAGESLATMVPDERMQVAIGDAVRAVVAAGGAAVDMPEILGDLERAAPGRPELLQQVVLFLGNSRSTEAAMGGALLLHALEFTFEEKTEAVLPVLDHLERHDRGGGKGVDGKHAEHGQEGGDDGHLTAAAARVRSLLYDVLATVDRVEGGPADFSLYARLLRDDRFRAGLIRYLYDVDPAAALRVLQDIHGTAEARPFLGLIARVDRVQSLLDARDAGGRWSAAETEELAGDLAELAGHESWWVRLYAVAGLESVPELAETGLRERLVGDDHPLVSRAAEEIPSP